jgi:glucose-1-phosphate cytidylyltransferase
MIACILAGGKGLRLGDNLPKPLVSIAGKPMIEHVMDIYADYGITDFVVLMGWHSQVIRDWFVDHRDRYKKWNIYLRDTGEESTTGSRIVQGLEFLDQEKDVCFTYADGLANVNIEDLIEGHVRNKKTATMTVVHPQDKFGVVTVGNWGRVEEIYEKPIDTRWINGGFFVLSQNVQRYIDPDLPFEKQALPALAQAHMLWSYAHWKFWECVDTQKDLDYIKELAKSKHLPWRR